MLRLGGSMAPGNVEFVFHPRALLWQKCGHREGVAFSMRVMMAWPTAGRLGGEPPVLFPGAQTSAKAAIVSLKVSGSARTQLAAPCPGITSVSPPPSRRASCPRPDRRRRRIPHALLSRIRLIGFVPVTKTAGRSHPRPAQSFQGMRQTHSPPLVRTSRWRSDKNCAPCPARCLLADRITSA